MVDGHGDRDNATGGGVARFVGRRLRRGGVWLLLMVAGSAWAGGVAGCRAADSLGTVQLDRRASDRSGEAVVLSRFRAAEPRAGVDAGGGAVWGTAGDGIRVRTEGEAREGVVGVEAVVGTPGEIVNAGGTDVGGDGAGRSGGSVGLGGVDEVLVDQVVGQINGDPVYAAAFFEPMDARFRAEAAEVESAGDQRAFLRSMSSRIAQELMSQTRDRLLLDEFRTSLSEEERVGVVAFIERIQADLQRQSLGSRELANRRTMDEQGRTFEEQVRFLSDQEFIREQLRRAISNRVSVSSRDIQQEYERRIDEFQPAPTAVLRVIRARTSRAGRVADALASGRAFVEVAEEFSRWRVDDGNLHEVTIEGGRMDAAEFFGVDALNDAARGLSVGEVVGPIEVGSSSWWLRLDEIRREPGVSLYEAQLELEEEIRGRRFVEEQERYFEELFERSNITGFETMVERLTTFGARRYLGAVITEGSTLESSGSGGRSR